MKATKKILGILVVMALLLTMSLPAFAAGEGSITITNSNTSVSMEGHTYNAYKVLDLSWDGEDSYAYTIATGFQAFFNTLLSKPIDEDATDTEAYNYIAALATDAARQTFASLLLTYITTNTIPVAGSVTADDSETATISNLDLGYYLVADAGTNAATPTEAQTVVAALALTTTDAVGQIALKANAPTLDKNVVTVIEGEDEEEDTTVYSESNTASIGDVIDYALTSSVPDMTGYTKYFYVITDTMSAGLTFNDDIVVKLDGETLESGTDYTVTTDTTTTPGSTVIKIVFVDFIQYLADKGAPIVVSYSATLNEDAVAGVDGNTNEAVLVYSNNPLVTPESETDEPEEEDPTGETPKQFTKTFLTGIELIKFTELADGSKLRLTGAEFSITGEMVNKVLVTTDEFVLDAEDGTYYLLKDGTYTLDAPDGTNDDLYESTTDLYEKTQVSTLEESTDLVDVTATVGDDGVLRLDGLAEGTYVITELTAPSGYNLLEAPMTVVITGSYPAAITTGNEVATWSYTLDGGASQPATGGIVTLEVENNSGNVLPGTGGSGTTIFYITGMILLLGALVLLVAKKKAKN